MFFLLLLGLIRCEGAPEKDMFTFVTDFIFHAVTVQDFGKTLLGMTNEEAENFSQELLDFAGSVSENNKASQDLIDAYKEVELELFMDYDTKLIEFFLDETKQPDDEFINSFIETSKKFSSRNQIFRNILKSLGYTGPHGLDFLTLIETKKGLEENSIKDLFDYMGIDLNSVMDKLKELLNYLRGTATMKVVLLALGVTEEHIKNMYDFIHNEMSKNEWSLNFFIEGYEAEAYIFIDMIKDIYNTILKDLYNVASSNFDINQVNISNAIQETYNFAKSLRGEFDQSFDDLVDQMEQFMNNGLNLTQLIFQDLDKDDINLYFDPVKKVLTKGSTLKDYLDIAKKYLDPETNEIITNVVDGIHKLGIETLPLQEAIKSLYVPDPSTIYQYIKDTIKSVGTRTGNFYDGLTDVLYPEDLDLLKTIFTKDFKDFIQMIDDINQTFQEYCDIPQDIMDTIDEWIPLHKTLKDFFNVFGTNINDVASSIEGIVVKLDELRDELDVEWIYNQLTTLLNALKESKDSTTIEAFLTKLGWNVDKFLPSLNKVWNSFKNEPIPNVVAIADEEIKYVKVYQSLIQMSKLQYYNLQTLYNAIVYDKSYDPNFMDIISFIPKFEERLYTTSQKVINGNELVLNDVISLLFIEKYFFKVVNETMNVYEKMDMSLVSIIYNITDYNFENTSIQLVNIIDKVVNGELVSFNDVKSIENSIAETIDNPEGKKKNSNTTLIIIVCTCVGVIAIVVIVVVFIVIRRKHRLAKFETTGGTQNLLI